MAQMTCSSCGTSWPAGYQFCGRCGSSMNISDKFTAVPAPPPGPAPVEPPPGILFDDPLSAQISYPDASIVRFVVLRGPVLEGTAFELPEGRVHIGRAAELSMSADSLMAPRHVAIDRFGERVSVDEITGPGGCFLRIREPMSMLSGEVIFAGEQYLLVRSGQDIPTEPASAYAPPETFGTPLPAPRLHVTQLLAGGVPGRVVSTDREQLTVGREGCDLSFPQDRFMSGRHLRIDLLPDGSLQVTDVGSLNGTFERLTQTPALLRRGDEILIGSTLLRLEIRAAEEA